MIKSLSYDCGKIFGGTQEKVQKLSCLELVANEIPYGVLILSGATLNTTGEKYGKKKNWSWIADNCNDIRDSRNVTRYGGSLSQWNMAPR